MADNPLTKALNTLDTTIQTITAKVEASKSGVRDYKAKIIDKLKEINVVINNLKTKINSSLAALPELRQKLQDNQAALQTKTEELDQTKGQLVVANRDLEQSQQNITRINQQLETVNQQLAELTTSGEQKDTAIRNLNAEKEALTAQVAYLNAQKTAAESGLAAAQRETSDLVVRIGVINANLVQQIQLIDTIVNELGNLDSGDVSEQFNAVSSNIQAIMHMINNSSPGTTVQGGQQPIYNVEQNFNRLKSLSSQNENYRQFISGLSNPNLKSAILANNNKDDPASIATLKQILEQNKIIVPTNMTGGKSRRHKRRGGRKTMKKKHRKTRNLAKKNYRGGYVYSSSKDLDKASSIISASLNSNSNFNSNSKSKSKSNSSKKSHKTKRRSKQ
jgi:DNA repair exonuclease SbcCD ATPase subunit